MTLLHRSGGPDIVRCVDETDVGGPVSFVEQPVTFELPAPSHGLTLEEWRRREARAGDVKASDVAAGVNPLPHAAMAQRRAAAAAGREGHGSAAVALPVPHQEVGHGRA